MYLRVYSFCLLLICFNSYAQTKIKIPYGQLKQNLTSRYEFSKSFAPNAIWQLPTAKSGEGIFAYKILLVPGFLANTINDFRRYFLGQKELFRRAGLRENIDFAYVSVNGSANMATNKRTLARAIRQSKKPVIIMSHSKGSIDTLHTLLKQPSLQAKVKGWINIQGVIFGSQYADTVLGKWFERKVFKLLLNSTGGSILTLYELSTLSRYAYMRTVDTKLAELNQRIPIISFASWQETPDLPKILFYIWLFYGAEIFARANDGLVAVDHALLPGSDYVIESGFNHFDPVLSSNFDTDSMTSILLMLLLEKIEQKRVSLDKISSYAY